MSERYAAAELDRLLDAALDLPEADRLAFARREAGDRPGLLRAVEDVLREAAGNDGFLAPDGAPAAALREAVLGSADDDSVAALSPGETFTTFRVVELIGRGGMGEVYRAEDPRLGRHVALKVLPRAFIEDPHRLARFEREARVLASLNHPNVGAIYGLAEDGGRQALVLEFVEGRDLADIIAGGPLPAREVLAIARQVALALDTAHRRGIVHRDLKPANIVVTGDGTVKVLDFGLAKAARRDGPDPGLTGVVPAGGMLGTPAYMAPEQAQGLDVDERADIWAFGCILFEMLTGERTFDGATPGETIGRVIGREPAYAQLPPGTHDALRRLLRRTLVKDPQRRLADIGDAVSDLAEAEKDADAGRRVVRIVVPLAALTALIVLVALFGGVPGRWPATHNATTAVRLAIPISPSEILLPSGQQLAAVSPDGRTIVYRAIRGGQSGLFKRVVGDLDSQLIPGTAHAAGPFFSPDGNWIGFDGDGVLQKVSISGGSPVTICEAPGGANASWGGDLIVFSTSTTRSLQRVAAAGGVPAQLTTLDPGAGDLAHSFPFVMPRADAVLFTVVRERESLVAVVRLDGSGIRTLIAGSQPRYVPTGHIVFVRDQSLWAAGFDDRRLAVTSEPRPVVEHLETAGGAAGHFAIADGGTLVYAPRREEVPERSVTWVDAAGAEVPAAIEPKRYARAALSPDGRHVALAASEDGNADIWIADLPAGRMRRLTREPTTETAPLWSPSGEAIVFRSDRDGGGLFMRVADGSGETERLTVARNTIQTPHGFTPDGRTVLFTDFRSYTSQAIAAVDVERPLDVRYLVEGPGARLRPQVSPDGRWLAYQSDESGQFEIYLRPYPDVERRAVQVSRGGGTSPRWAAEGGRLFYYDGRGLSSVDVPPGASLGDVAAGSVQRLFAYSPFTGRMGPDYDVAPGASRFLFIRGASDTPSSRVQLIVVQNWFSELRKSKGNE